MQNTYFIKDPDGGSYKKSKNSRSAESRIYLNSSSFFWKLKTQTGQLRSIRVLCSSKICIAGLLLFIPPFQCVFLKCVGSSSVIHISRCWLCLTLNIFVFLFKLVLAQSWSNDKGVSANRDERDLVKGECCKVLQNWHHQRSITVVTFPFSF